MVKVMLDLKWTIKLAVIPVLAVIKMKIFAKNAKNVTNS